jgi:DNA-binding LacI/PurR family transcriptional regulator
MSDKVNSNKITTLKDIAKQVGLSATAVSKALNDKGGISEETVKRVKDAAKRLNYTPNIVAKSLRLNRTKTIGVIVSDSSHSFLAKVVKAIEDTATIAGYNIILCNTNQSYDKERKAISVLINKRIDGLILAASMLTKKADIDFLKSFGVPFVFLIRRNESEDADYVVNDNVLGAYNMVNYLIKSGSKRIHFLNLNEESPSGRDRLQGYEKALRENGINYEPGLVRNVKPSIEEGYITMRSLLDKGEDIRTVFCGCDIIGIGVMEAIIEKGLKIPENIRVAAYDDIDFAAYLRVPLTTVHQPKEMIGCKGTELLIDKIKNRNSEPLHLILKPELVIRQST